MAVYELKLDAHVSSIGLKTAYSICCNFFVVGHLSISQKFPQKHLGQRILFYSWNLEFYGRGPSNYQLILILEFGANVSETITILVKCTFKLFHDTTKG